MSCKGSDDSNDFLSHDINIKNRTGDILYVEYEQCDTAIFIWETNKCETKKISIENSADVIITVYSERAMEWYDFYATYKGIKEHFSFGPLTTFLILNEDDFL